MNQRPNKTYTPGEALQKIAAFCTYQERNQREVAEKLRSYGLDEDEAGEIIIRLSREKLLDEERYAKSFVRGKYRQKKWGRRRIQQELKQKGLSDYCIKAGMKEIDGDEYYQNLTTLLEKKDAQEKERHPAKRRQKLTQFLTLKGYEQDLIRMALEDLGKAPEDADEAYED
ncbi:RecX family transcriptional regulator [Hymenobacter lutimineralis]|uniref:Regulatory protein RecX n=1 Tax=Hymenobacter lutimineralis TaxID=2606448 RepID=A0A5D6V9D7_9BACT|nr:MULTISPECIES: regulatory protein RecX [Hymenobacter]QIX61998.1 RecX family transcriptional regulator [Hymenobacter sp. BT18]TYZ12493.1 RecX family transcriptional regulator [Hymenobacter lutimineralis]